MLFTEKSWSATIDIPERITVGGGQSPDRDFSPCTSSHTDHDLYLPIMVGDHVLTGKKHGRRPWFDRCKSCSGEPGPPTMICHPIHQSTQTIHYMDCDHVISLSETMMKTMMKTMSKRGRGKNLDHYGPCPEAVRNARGLLFSRSPSLTSFIEE